MITNTSTRNNLRLLRQNRSALVAGVVVLLFVLAACLAPVIAPWDPNADDLLARLQPPAWMAGGAWDHPLGTDHLGRDILSRIIHGTSTSMTIGVLVVGLATVVGVFLGLLAGYYGGWLDVVISRIVDILLGFPYLIFALALVSVLGAGFWSIVIALLYKEWVIPCRVTRGETLATAPKDFPVAARALGASRAHIMFREILPNILSPIIVMTTIRIATIIILEATLAFLGLGVQSPMVSWGGMVADGRTYVYQAWWISTFPGLAILLLVLSINIFSQGLRDAFDPRFHV